MGKERKGKQREVKDGKAKKQMKRPRTTELQRVVARTLVLEGYSQSEAASRTRMSQASVSNAMRSSKRRVVIVTVKVSEMVGHEFRLIVMIVFWPAGPFKVALNLLPN